MPILPENKTLYPPDWQEIRARTLKRAGYKCEGCGVVNHSEVGRGKKLVEIVLTISHTDHDPTRNTEDNLRALCQSCHLSHDREYHKLRAAATRRMKKAGANRQLSLLDDQNELAGYQPG